MLIDVNLLLYAADSESPFHEQAASWLNEALNGARRVGFPRQVLVAFLRIATNPRAFDQPLKPAEAVCQAEEWLSAEMAWIPEPGAGHSQILHGLITRYQLTADIISDAHLAALAIEHGLVVYSADTDFARFTELRWENPLAPQ